MSEINYKDSSNLEVLRIARDLVLNEYNTRRAEEHNKWLVESDFLWRTQQLRVAYPALPPYPTEKDILERARLLLDFIENKKKNIDEILDDRPKNQDVIVTINSENQLSENVVANVSNNVITDKPEKSEENIVKIISDKDQENNSSNISEKSEENNVNITASNNSVKSNTVTESQSAQSANSLTTENKTEVHVEGNETSVNKELSPRNNTLISNSVLEAEKKLLDLSTEYFKLKKDVDEISPTSTGRLLPSIMKKIEDIRTSVIKDRPTP